MIPKLAFFVLLPEANVLFEYDHSVIKMTPPLYMENHTHINYKTLQNFYSSRSFVDKLLQYWKESDNTRPKFSYLAMTAPHCKDRGLSKRLKGILNERLLLSARAITSSR